MTRILVIEDDETTAREITAELGRRGFEVERAAVGREGLAKVVSGESAAATVRLRRRGGRQQPDAAISRPLGIFRESFLKLKSK